MFEKVAKMLGGNLINILGWRINRKIVVIESDDWGSIRMPSKKIYDQLMTKGFAVDKCPFSTNDSLASEDDLSALFEVLQSVKDQNNRPAIITANAVVTNPDFEAIRASNYEKYVYEPFTRTLEKYGSSHKNSLIMWQQGIQTGIFHPQFHGREHLNVNRWLKDLQMKDEMAHLMFDQEHWSLSYLNTDKMKTHYMAGFVDYSENDKLFYNESIKEGIAFFKSFFGYHSDSFIAPCFLWGNTIERILNDNGVKYIQGIPLRRDAETGKRVFQILGHKNQYNQTYLLRNISFEPTLNKNIDWIGESLKKVKIAFRWGKPVTINSHRMNYIGFIHEKNRTDNLLLLKTLLHNIIKLYPDVEFMSSDELGSLITKSNLHV